ncbi:MAG: cysteine peptidase family C39 domain-containing protein [Planctomycetaceae bacterium]
MRRTYRTVKQEDQTDCGAAALASVALFHGLQVGVQQMRDFAGTDRDGTNLLGLVEGAESLGFSARAVKGPFEALVDVPLPAIAHVVNDQGLGHFVVVFRISRKHVLIGDPARGTERISHDEFRQKWTGRLVLLTREQSAVANSTETAVSPLGRLLRLLRGHVPILAQGFLCAILMTVLGLSTSYFVQHLIDSVLVRNEQGLLNALGIGMMLILVFRTAFSMLRQYLLAHVSRKLDLAIMGCDRHAAGLSDAGYVI